MTQNVQNPKVSVVVPTYMRIEMLLRALRSILNQEFQDYECLVINDDPTSKLEVDRLVAKLNDSRLRVIHNSTNKGGNFCRNLGVKESKGKIIAFLDDDDEWMPGKLAAHYQKHLDQAAACIIYSNTLKHFPNGKYPDLAIEKVLPPDVHSAIGEMKFNMLTSSVTLSRECLTSNDGFDESLPSMQDWDLWFRLSRNFPFVHLNAPLVRYYEHEDERVSRNYDKRLRALELVCQKHESDPGFCERIVRQYISRSALLSEMKARSSESFFKGPFFVMEQFKFGLENSGLGYVILLLLRSLIPELLFRKIRRLVST